ncbi:hypothetical protein BS78_07G220500 [Paspalum vaginatum]|nr:hypothetical protein BS78_07G220500 [Paspalum vaginatum]
MLSLLGRRRRNRDRQLAMPPSPAPAGREGRSRDDDDKEMTNLPDDQVFEVLTRVPLDDLAACRAVSTRWRAITYEPAFAPLHCRRAGAFSGYLVQTTTRYGCGHIADFVSAHHPSPAAPLSLDFVPRPGRPWSREDVRVVAVAPRLGLACCVAAGTGRSPPRYYVCKPATRQWRALPNPRLRFPTVATAMAALRSSDGEGAVEFRIVRLSSHVRGQYQYDSMRCEVFDSRRFAWRRAEDVPVPSVSLFGWGPAVHAHGAAHWLCCPYWDHRITHVVFALDVGTGAWWLIALPREVEDVTARYRWSHRQITAVDGRLCLMVTMGGAGEVLEVWEMASYAEARWEKKTRVSLKGLDELGEGGRVIPQHLDSSGVAFLDTGRRAIWYDLQRGEKIAQVQMNHKRAGEIFKFESDMTPCQTMGGRACQSSAATPMKQVDRGASIS